MTLFADTLKTTVRSDAPDGLLRGLEAVHAHLEAHQGQDVRARVRQAYAERGRPQTHLEPGEVLGDFALPAFRGETKLAHERLSEACTRGPVLLLVYRGGWCPFDAAWLQHVDHHAATFAARGLTVWGLSAQDEDHTAHTAQAWGMANVPLLSDAGGDMLNSWGLVHEAPPIASPARFGVNMHSVQQGRPAPAWPAALAVNSGRIHALHIARTPWDRLNAFALTDLFAD